MNKLILLALVSVSSIWATQPDFFPLQVGNQWVLQTTSASPQLLTIEVLRSRVQNGETYYLLSGYAPDSLWVRQTADGALVAIDEKLGEERKLAQLAAGRGGYRTTLGGCDQLGHPFAVTTPHRGSNFDFTESLTIAYVSTSCRDVGIEKETYAPNVGLAQRSIITIGGPVTFDLAYARVAGSAVLGKSKEIVLVHNFNHGSRGWLAGFTDYNLRTSDLRMFAELRTLPEEVDARRSGFFIQSMNRSDDIFMFLKKLVGPEEGLEPNQVYHISYNIQFSSNAPTGCVGIGGSPGDSVYLKAGATMDEPLASLAEAGEVRLSVDKGQQSVGGRDAGVVGTIANGTSCIGSSHPFVSVRKAYAHPYPVRTDDRGSLWFLSGTDSAYEGLTGVYFESITVRINPAVAPANSTSSMHD